MLLIGSHVGFSKEQFLGSVKESLSYGSTAFMFYTGAPQNTLRSNINDSLTNEGKGLLKSSDIKLENVVVHAPYIINLANRKDESKYNFSIEFLINEVNRCERLGVTKLVLHPGSHVGEGVDVGLNNIVNGLDKVFENCQNVDILLETMAGKGTELGRTIDELKYIFDNVKDKSHLGICLDTCHLNDAGYEIGEFDKILDEIEEKIGLEKIKCVHINDSKNQLASHKDRHENIGFGTIGFEKIVNVVYSERLKDIPKILETPYIDDKAPYKEEIEMIKNKKFDINLKEKIINK